MWNMLRGRGKGDDKGKDEDRATADEADEKSGCRQTSPLMEEVGGVLQGHPKLEHRMSRQEILDVVQEEEAIPAAPLSQDAYGVAILCIVQGFDAIHGHHAGKSSKLHGLLAVAFGMFLLILNGSVQIFLIVYTKNYVLRSSVQKMRDVYENFHTDVFSPDGEFLEPAWAEWDVLQKTVICQFPFSQTSFFFCILFLWSLVIAGEFRACIRWVKDLHELPENNSGANMTVKEDQCFIISTRAGSRWILYLAAVLPKFSIAGVVWWIGCRWLASTPAFGDLILNSCALSFIMNVDEIIWEALVPEGLRMQVERTSVFSSRFSSKHLSDQWKEIPVFSYLTTIGHLSLAFLLTWLYIFKLQTVLPNYEWDVTQHCNDY